MPDVPYFLLKELAILRIQFRVGFPEREEQFAQVEHVLLKYAGNNDSVVQVHET
jgi:hypothetical protein